MKTRALTNFRGTTVPLSPAKNTFGLGKQCWQFPPENFCIYLEVPTSTLTQRLWQLPRPNCLGNAVQQSDRTRAIQSMVPDPIGLGGSY